MTSERSRRVFLLPLAGILLLAASPLLPRVARHPMIVGTVLAAAALLGVWTAVLYARARRGVEYRLDVVLRKNHYLQLVVQLVLFAYWWMYWPKGTDQIALILVQLVFAYVLDMLLLWSKHREWRAGFSVVPPVLSVNLFLWFHDEYFPLQFAVIALAFVTKALVHWKREGRSTHIFNPSGIALWVPAVIMIAGGWWGVARANEISSTLGAPPYIYEAMAIASLLVQFYYPVILITMSAALTVVAAGFVYTTVTGVYLFIDTSIPIAVFLGMLLLITDPSTSPRSWPGRVLFGVLYGLSIAGCYIALRETGRPSYFDKLLFVPVLNLAVPAIERWGRRVELAIGRARFSVREANTAHLAVWIGVFAVMLPWLKAHAGRSPEYWQRACAEGRHGACNSLAALYGDACERGVGEACHNLGAMFEGGEAGPADPARALVAYERGCREGAAASCDRAGTMHGLGEGVPRNEPRAAVFYGNACTAGEPAGCHNLGVAFENGLGVLRDTAQALSFYDRACHAGFGPACENGRRLRMR